jgi:hypothetical protein
MKASIFVFTRMLILLPVFLGGCEKLSVDRFGRTEAPSSKQEALTMKELSFMVRVNSSEAEILELVSRRGIAEPIAAAELSALGAKPQFVETLKNSPYVLTRAERDLYEKRVEKRKAGVAEQEQSEQQFVDNQRASMNQRIQSAERTRLESQASDFQAKISSIAKEQSKVPYSKSSNSPYQLRAEEIVKVKQELARVNASLQKL